MNQYDTFVGAYILENITANLNPKTWESCGKPANDMMSLNWIVPTTPEAFHHL